VEASEERPGSPGVVPKEAAWDVVREAQASWAGAMRAHELAPPDPGFRARLRALSEAAAAMRDAHARALEAGLAWRPVAGSNRARPPYELRPGTGRRGPDELWTQFDAAVEQLNAAGGGDSVADVVAAEAGASDQLRDTVALPRAHGASRLSVRSKRACAARLLTRSYPPGDQEPTTGR
jgi:hypothetical protein